MQLEWDERKRERNVRVHGFDFVDVPVVFAGPTFTFEGDRFEYGEPRFVTLGLLQGVVVTIAHTESELIRVISFRRASKHEQAIFFRQVPNGLGANPSDDGS